MAVSSGSSPPAGSNAGGQGWIDTTDRRAEVSKHVTFYQTTAPEREAAHATQKPNKSKFILAARKDEQHHFFDGGKDRKIKIIVSKWFAAGSNQRQHGKHGRHSAGATPPYSSRFLPFLPFSNKIDAKHLAHAPGSIPGLATI